MSDSATPQASPHWPEQRPERLIVVGVDAEQRASVVQEVAALATTMSAGLVCAWVDSTQVIYGATLDGTRLITPLDPDQAASSSDAIREQVRQHVAGVLGDSPVPWRLETAVGDIAGHLVHTQTRPVLVIPGTARDD